MFSTTDILEEFVEASHVVEWVDFQMYRTGGVHIFCEEPGQKSERQRRARQDHPELHKRLDHERYMTRREAALAQQREYYARRGRELRDARVSVARANKKALNLPKRPKTLLTREIEVSVMNMLAEGAPIATVARSIPLSRSCIYNIIKKANTTEQSGG